MVPVIRKTILWWQILRLGCGGGRASRRVGSPAHGGRRGNGPQAVAADLGPARPDPLGGSSSWVGLDGFRPCARICFACAAFPSLLVGISNERFCLLLFWFEGLSPRRNSLLRSAGADGVATSMSVANLLGGHRHGDAPIELQGKPRVWLPDGTITSRKGGNGPGRVSPLVPVQSRTGINEGNGPGS